VWGKSKSAQQGSPALHLPVQGKMEEQQHGRVKPPPNPAVCPGRLLRAGLGSWAAQQRGGSGLAGTTSTAEPWAAALCCCPVLLPSAHRQGQRQGAEMLL